MTPFRGLWPGRRPPHPPVAETAHLPHFASGRVADEQAFTHYPIDSTFGGIDAGVPL